MLKKRIIPKLLLKNSKKNVPILVNSYQFEKFKIIGSPIPQAKIFEAQYADQLILLNIDSIEINKDNKMIELLKKFSENIFMPLTFGGGIKTLNCIEILLKNGADKICINTAAVKNKKIITEASKAFGSQCIVVSIDFKLNNKIYEVFIDRGKTNTRMNVFDWSDEVQELGAGEVVLTDILLDGTAKGLNIFVSNKISKKLEIPVIISGGCGLAEHFVECFKNTEIQGIAAGNFFSNKDQNIYQTRSQLINNNIPLRKV